MTIIDRGSFTMTNNMYLCQTDCLSRVISGPIEVLQVVGKKYSSHLIFASDYIL